MNSTTLICKRCKAPLYFEEGSSIAQCRHCGYIEMLDESDEVTKERIRAKAFKETEIEKRIIEKEEGLEGKKLRIEEKRLGLKKVKAVIITIILLALIGLGAFGVVTGQRRGKVPIEQTYEYFIGKDYQQVHKILTEAGFTHIENSSQAILSKKQQYLDGKVTQVSIGGNPTFSKGWYPKDATITIYYNTLDPKHANDIRIPFSQSDYVGMNYQTILYKLEDAGFINISVEPLNDLRRDSQSLDGIVKRITIDNNETFYPDDYFAPDTSIKIEYHSLDPKRMTDVQIPSSYDTFAEMDYLAACKVFINAGFTNITLIPQYDVRFYEGSKSGVIQSIKVNGITRFEEGKWLPYDTEVKITYRTKPFKYVGENYENIEHELSAIGFFDIELKALNDLGVNDLKKAYQVDCVKINDVELSEAEELNLRAHIIIQYHSEKQATSNQTKIATASKDLVGKNYEEVVDALRAMGFANVRAVALDDLSSEIIHKSGNVSEVSIGGITKFSVGEIFEKSAETIVSYHSLKPKPTPTPEPQAGEGEVEISVASKDLKGKDYREVVSMLSEMGFMNIKTNPLGDLKKGWLYDEGEVKSISIAGTTNFSVGEIFEIDAEIVISYHSFPE